MYYYAELNDNDICIGVFESLTALADSNYIEVDSLNANLVGMLYNRETGTWETPPFSVIAAHSTDEINYKTTNQSLSDVLDGKASTSHSHTGYASANHTHTGFAAESHTHSEYAPVEHTHSGYASSSHTHAISDITNLQSTLNGKASSSHTHSGYAQTEHTHEVADVTGLNSALSGKADSNHTHDYAATTHNHTIAQVTGLQTALNGKAASSHTHDYAPTNHTHTGFAASEHTHSIANVSGLNDALNGKASTSHTHDYAPTNHTHDYLSTAGGTLTGNLILDGAVIRAKGSSGYAQVGGAETIGHGARLNVFGKDHATDAGKFALIANNGTNAYNLEGAPNGALTWSGNVFKIGGQQAVYITDSRITFGTTNRETYLTGSTIYSRSAIQVASDARLKTDIEDADAERAIEFIRNLKIHDYRYKDSDEKRVGVIAQELLSDEYGKKFVKEGEDGTLSVSYSELIFPLIMAVQKLMNKE